MSTTNDKSTESSLGKAVEYIETHLDFSATNEQKLTIALEVYKAQMNAKGLEKVAKGLGDVAEAIEKSSKPSLWLNEPLVRFAFDALENFHYNGVKVKQVDE